jgi:D-methionine transport system permease protein
MPKPRALLATLKDINQRLDVTIVIVSHELDVIGEICNRVAVIENGAIAEQFALDDATSLSRRASPRWAANWPPPRCASTLAVRRCRRPPMSELISSLAVSAGAIYAMLPEMWEALGQTLLMLGIGLSAAVLIGGPLGIVLFLVADGQSLQNRPAALVLGWLVNTVRSFPFIILLVALVPFTRVIAGTSIGPLAAAVPLSFAAIPYFARLVEQNLREVPRGVIEAAHAMGASELQIILRVLLVEARSGLVLALTVLSISFLSYSAVAGVVGGGGIGDLAIRYGYYRFETDIMVATVAVLILLVQLIQFTGNRIAKRIDKR